MHRYRFTPTGNRLLPLRRARRAPASTTSTPVSDSHLPEYSVSVFQGGCQRRKARSQFFAGHQAGQNVFFIPAAITTVVPERLARSAAWSLVSMPPVPNFPAVLRRIQTNCGIDGVTISWISSADGSVRGSAVKSPGWSVSITSRSASIRFATSADKLSLSPRRISSVATVSFSLTIG